MANYCPTIGLEVHAELKTKTKMFCGCRNDPDEQHPNTNVCPVCLGHPGTLPVPNAAAIEDVLLVGMALKGDIPAVSKFDRKNYFYPDLPKGYQISQYDVPFVFGGMLSGVHITRVHLEEDAGALTHANQKSKTQNAKEDYSLVNFNRAGVPLMELVTEPDMHSADEALKFARELQILLRYLEVSDADMDRGLMRVEVNISLAEKNSKTLGTKVEVKNIASFKAVRGAIEYEIARQTALLDKGDKVIQETRGWDDVAARTVSQRSKEGAHDYRYFPDPDIPPIDLSKINLKTIELRLPELPQAKRVRFAKEFNLKSEHIEALVFDRDFAGYFENIVSEFKADKNEFVERKSALAINYLLSDLRGLILELGVEFNQLKISAENFADLIELIDGNIVSSRGAKDLLKIMMRTGGDARDILRDNNFAQVSDESALREVVARVISANPQAVVDFKKGKENAVQFMIGKCMAELKGKGNPQVLQKLIREALSVS